MTSAASATVLQLLDVLADPAAAFRRIGEGRCRWLLVALAAGLVAAVLQYVQYGALFRESAASFAPEHVEQVRARFAQLQILGSATAPLVVLGRIVLAAYFVWIGASFAGITIGLERVLAIAASAQIVVILHGAVNAAIVALAHLPPQHRFELGLNLIVPAGPLAAYVSLVNPFTLWYLALIVAGLCALGGARPRTAVLALVPYALVYLVFFAFQQSVVGGRL